MAFFKTACLKFAVRELPTLGAPCLKGAAAAVPESMFNTEELDRLVEDLVDTMNHANGAGIAAPQIAEPWRVFVVHGTGKNPRYPYKPAVPLTVFVNPEIEILDDYPMRIAEGCLSVPGMRGFVYRACKVRVNARRPDGSHFSLRAEGHVAGTLQHEQDHLDGRLFPDHSHLLMSAESFEEHYKDEFFDYAHSLNERYPTPIAWEDETMPAVGNARFAATTDRSDGAVVSDIVVYAPELVWTGDCFERNCRISVDSSTGRVISVDVGDAKTSGHNPTTCVLDDCALIPGFVNAHSHAFQRMLRGRGETYDGGKASFWTWREAMYELVQELGSREAFKAATRGCFEEMAAAGITTCGEFHYLRHSEDATALHEPFDLDEAVMEAASEANVRLVLLSAFYERGGFDDSPLADGQSRFRTSSVDAYCDQLDRIARRLEDSSRGDSAGVVVHSLRAVSVDALRRLAREAFDRGMCLHVHLEEQPKEIEDCLDAHGMTPMALLLSSVESPDHLSRVCGVHCTHTEAADLERFLAAGGNVCVCPLTEAALGDGVFKPLDTTQGIVSLGTDCNARIDMFEEMRWLEYSQRLARGRRGVVGTGNLAAKLLECATIHGAAALGLEGEVGTIEPGAWADFATIDLTAASLRDIEDEHLLGAAIFGGSSEGLVLDTCVAGVWTGGRAWGE
eukprot:g1015.t1